MKKSLIVAGFLLAAAAVIATGYYIASRFLAAQSSTSISGISTCRVTYTHHQASVTNNSIVPTHTDGALCDTLTITNHDDPLRLIAFGPHDDHQPYDGVTEQELAKGQSFTITFNKVGTFEYHDHIDDVAQGDFTVSK